MTISYKSAPFELKREPDTDGVFEGYASVFGVVDQGDDVVERGAFTKSLASGRKVRLLWQHDSWQPIGVWDEIREDDRGLYVKGRVLKDVQQGSEALALLKAGALDSMSIGYRTIESMQEGKGGVRKLTEVDLFEVSLVTFPMLPEAMVTDVKSIKSEREFERFLRDAGYSKKEATALTLHGFKALTDRRDAVVADEHDDEAVAMRALLEQIQKLQETIHV